MEAFIKSPFLIGVTSWLAVSYGIYRLFEKAEDVLNANTKKAVTHWLKNVQMPESVNNWPQTFAETFDAVFGSRHFSWKCFLRSCIASTFSFVFMFFIWAALRPQEFGEVSFDWGYFFNAFLVLVILNLIPDYLSLLETRFVIKLMTRTPSALRFVPLLLVDVVLTALLALTFLPVILKIGVFDLLWATSGSWTGIEGSSLLMLLSTYYREALPLTATSLIMRDRLYIEPFPFFSISFYTAFFTSVWIWLYAFSGFLVKIFSSLNVTLAFFRKRFDINKKPLSALGFVAMLIVTMFYIAVPFIPASEERQDVLPSGEPITLRSTPATLSVEEVRNMLQQKGLFDRFLSPRKSGIKHHYAVIEHASATVVFDSTTGLYWQQSGSDSALTYEEAQSYIQKLNAENYGGYSDWRLPTLEEAMSLMEPYGDVGKGKLFIDSVFDTKQWWIWTADKTLAGHVWYVGFYDGYCNYNDVNFNLDVRAVRS